MIDHSWNFLTPIFIVWWWEEIFQFERKFMVLYDIIDPSGRWWGSKEFIWKIGSSYLVVVWVHHNCILHSKFGCIFDNFIWGAYKLFREELDICLYFNYRKIWLLSLSCSRLIILPSKNHKDAVIKTIFRK